MKCLIPLSLLLIGAQAVTKLCVSFSWKELSFSWPNETFKNESINSGDYVSKNNVPLGVAVWNNKVFMTIPRWYTGVAASLVYFDRNTANKSPEVTPYPGWDNHNIKSYSSETIVNSPRLNVDSCNRMWLVDQGTSNFIATPETVGPATIFVIDLETDEIVRRYDLKSTDKSDQSFFAFVVIDIDGDNCDDAYAYITDLGNYGLIVYSYGQNDSWTFTHPFFSFEPLHGNYWFQGLNFQYSDGIFGAALGPRAADGYRTVYFHPLVSNNEFSVNTRVLKNSSLVANNDYYYWKHEGHKGKNTSSLISAFDETTNTLITGQFEANGIGCWNPKQNLNPNTFHILAKDAVNVAFPSGLIIDADRNLWVITNKLPFFQFSTLNSSETNFRILTAPVDDLISGTGCHIR